MTETTIVAQQPTDQIAEALENLQISTKIEEVPESKNAINRGEEDSEVQKDSENPKSQKTKNPKSEEPQKRQKNPRKPQHKYQPRGRAGYPMKVKIEKGSGDQTDFEKSILPEKAPRKREPIDAKFAYRPLFWGAPTHIFQHIPKPVPLLSLKLTRPVPDSQRIYYFNPPSVKKIPARQRYQPDPQHDPSCFHEERTAHPELVVNVNSARHYLDSTPLIPRQIPEILNRFNAWRRLHEEDKPFHTWILSNLVDMDGANFENSIDAESREMKGPYSSRGVRRMQNWMDMHETWRGEFTNYPVILFIREQQ